MPVERRKGAQQTPNSKPEAQGASSPPEAEVAELEGHDDASSLPFKPWQAGILIFVALWIMRYGLTHFILCIIILLALVFLALYLAPYWLGPSIKDTLENRLSELFGVMVAIDRVTVNILSARVHARDLQIKNPNGYECEHLITVGWFVLDIDMLTLLRTTLLSKLGFGGAMHVIIQKLVFSHVRANVEKHNIRTSNFKELLDYLTGPAEGEPVKDAQSEEKTDTEDQEGRKITLKEVKFLGVDVRFQVEGTIFGVGLANGCDINVADIVFKEFSKEIGDTNAVDVAVLLFRTFLQTVLMHIAGKRIGGHLF